ncbi:14947_t:CDS:2, partial [Entrophospora sp. SA101]
SPKANSYIHLYQEIVKAEAENDTTSQNHTFTNTTWSLLGYLKYRECEDDFTSDKSTEHMSYVKNLEYLKENSKECQQPAEYILVGDSGVHPSLSIKYEKMSEDVNSFWQSINMKKQLDIKKLQCAGNALDAITNETHLRSVVMSEIISIMKHPLEHSDDVYHNEIGTLAFYIIYQQSVSSNNKEFERWLRKYKRFAGAMTVLSMVHIEVLRLLNSKFLGLEIFKARFDHGAVKKIFIGGLFNLIIEDIPQLVIAALYQQKTQSREVIPILTIISGVIMLLNDLISRIYELITVPKPRKSDVNPSNIINSNPGLNETSLYPKHSNKSGNLDNTSNPSLGNPNFYSNHINNSSHHDLNGNYRSLDQNYPLQPITNYPLQPITNYPLQPTTNYPLQPTTNYPLQPITNYPLSLTTQPIVPNNQQIEISPEGQPYTTGYVYVPN